MVPFDIGKDASFGFAFVVRCFGLLVGFGLFSRGRLLSESAGNFCEKSALVASSGIV